MQVEQRTRKSFLQHDSLEIDLIFPQCTFGIPCDACTKRTESNILAQELCTRQGLVAARFNNVGIYHKDISIKVSLLTHLEYRSTRNHPLQEYTCTAALAIGQDNPKGSVLVLAELLYREFPQSSH